MGEKLGRGRPKAEVPTQQVAFRLPLPLEARIDQVVETLQQERPGLNVTRAADPDKHPH